MQSVQISKIAGYDDSIVSYISGKVQMLAFYCKLVIKCNVIRSQEFVLKGAIMVYKNKRGRLGGSLFIYLFMCWSCRMPGVVLS